MKRSKKLLAIFVIVLVLVLGATSLVACGAKKMSEEDFSSMLVNGMGSIDNGYYFNIDTHASYTYEKDASKIKYDLIVQGTLDIDPSVKNTFDNQLKFELNQTINGEETKTLLGIYYKDSECATVADWNDEKAKKVPVLYINLAGYKYAFDTYSIKKMVCDLDKSASDSLDVPADELLKTLGPELIKWFAKDGTFKTKTVKKEIITTVELDLNQGIGKLMTLLGEVVDLDSILEGINAKTDGGEAFTLDTLMNLNLNMPTVFECRYEKPKKKKDVAKFKSATITIKVAEDHNVNLGIGDKWIISSDDSNDALMNGVIPKCNVTIGIEKLALYSGDKLNITEFPSNDALAGFKNVSPINIAIDGKIRFSNSKNPNVQTWEQDLIIRADINPIPLAYMNPDWDTKQAVFASLGMLHVAITDPEKNGQRANSLLELRYDPNSAGGSDYVFVTLKTKNAMATVNVKMDASALEGLFEALKAKFAPPDTSKTSASNEVNLMADGDVNNIAGELGGVISGFVNGALKSILNLADPTLLDKELSEGNKDTTVSKTLDKISRIVTKLTAEDGKGGLKLGTVTRGKQENVFAELNITRVLEELNEEFKLGAIVDTIGGLIPDFIGGDIINIEFTGISYGEVGADYDAFQYAKKNNNGKTATNTVVGIEGIKNLKTTMTRAEFEKMFLPTKDAADKEIAKNVSLDCKMLDGKTRTISTYSVYLIDGYDKTATGSQTITMAFKDSYNGIDELLGLLGIFAEGLDLSAYPIGFEGFQFTVNITD